MDIPQQERDGVVYSWRKSESQEVRIALIDHDGKERIDVRYFSRAFPTRRGVSLEATLADANELVRGATAVRDHLAERAKAA